MSETEKKPFHWKSLALFEGVTLGAGGAIAFLTRSSMAVYDSIAKPSFAPPPWIFPVAWTALYGAMAVAAWLVFRDKKPGYRDMTALYFTQLVVNLAWPVIFFVLKAFGLSFIWLVLLWTLVVFLVCRAFAANKAAGWLLTPYLAWTTFAAALNFSVAQLNR